MGRVQRAGQGNPSGRNNMQLGAAADDMGDVNACQDQTSVMFLFFSLDSRRALVSPRFGCSWAQGVLAGRNLGEPGQRWVGGCCAHRWTWGPAWFVVQACRVWECWCLGWGSAGAPKDVGKVRWGKTMSRMCQLRFRLFRTSDRTLHHGHHVMPCMMRVCAHDVRLRA